MNLHSLAAAIAAAVGVLAVAPPAKAQDVSAAPILQVFETQWDTIDDRMADIFMSGYGRLWLPPPQRADSGGLSVGYDVFDRFDLGSPRDQTLYGTETGLKTLVSGAHTAGVRVNTDFILNHNGFSDNSTVDNRGTPALIDDVSWEEGGGYPGFLPSADGLPYGDFHAPESVDVDRFTGRLSGLNDIDHTLNLEYIRHPVAEGDPNNIPAGETGIFGRPPANLPDPNNARFYPDQGLGSRTVYDPAFGADVTLYDFSTVDPLQGDAVQENALGLMLRNARWMIQEIGVDGFRLDAARHFPQWVLNYFDQAVFDSKTETLLDGSPLHPFTFIETGGDGDIPYLQGFIRKDVTDDLSTLGGNRDALDFNLFFAIKDNLSDNGIANDWRSIKNISIDASDEGFANNGSQGVSFARSHDDGPAHLDNVAHAYLLMRPGNAIVYQNGKQFGENRDFPQDGRGDSLGGLYGDAVTTLVDIRNTHGRGNYLDRTPADSASQKELLIYERENSALVVLNNRGDSGFDQRTVQTAFAPGTRLVELTGNAANATIDPNDDLDEVLTVGATGQVIVRAPRNQSMVPDGLGGFEAVDHLSGYLIYGLPRPEAQMRLTSAAGADLDDVLPGSTPVAGQGGPDGPSDDFYNGNTRLTDITVVTADSFKLRVESGAVTLSDGYRDRHADGDFAQFRVDDGLDANGNGAVDETDPDSVAYAFEDFLDTNSPGFFDAAGEGLYEQSIDTTQLAEGRHYVTSRVYRHRDPGTTTDGDPATAGDDGPAVFTEMREVIYVDRLAPESAIVSFEPYQNDPAATENRDLIARSTDGTADSMHLFLDLPAGMSDAAILQMAQNGENTAGQFDSDSWIFGFDAGSDKEVISGNHVATIVTFEPTGNSSVRRFAGLTTDTRLGAGLGDLDADGVFEVADISGAGGFEQVLASGNNEFNAAADANGDGLVDTRDLIDLGPELLSGGAASPVLAEYSEALLRRADLDGDGQADADDLALLYDNAGSADPLFDLDLDGTADAADAELLVTQLARTAPGDFNLDGTVDAADYTLWRDGQASGSLVADADFDGDVDTDDYGVWATAYGAVRGAYGASALAVPEPTAAVLLTLAAGLAPGRRRQARKQGSED